VSKIQNLYKASLFYENSKNGWIIYLVSALCYGKQISRIII